MDEPWILVGVFPGFLSGVIFSVVLGIVARRRKFAELSVAKFAGWGAFSGFIIGALPSVIGDWKPVNGNVWVLPLVVASSITLLSAVSAGASLALAKRSEGREPLEGAEDIKELR